MGRPRRRLFCALAALIEAGCCASFNFYVDHGASGADGSDTQTRAWPAASARTYATARASGRVSTTTRSQRRGKHAWPRHAAVPHLRACSGALAGGRAPRRSAEPRRRGSRHWHALPTSSTRTRGRRSRRCSTSHTTHHSKAARSAGRPSADVTQCELLNAA